MHITITSVVKIKTLVVSLERFGFHPGPSLYALMLRSHLTGGKTGGKTTAHWWSVIDFRTEGSHILWINFKGGIHIKFDCTKLPILVQICCVWPFLIVCTNGLGQSKILVPSNQNGHTNWIGHTYQICLRKLNKV